MKKASPWLGVGYCLTLGMVFVFAHVAAAAIRDSVLPLPGGWRFAFDHKDAGVAEGWFNPGRDRSSWRVVPVPHTWQVEPGNEKYFGVAWYARPVPPDPAWQEQDIRLEFDAVYRDATVYLNGEKIDTHTGSGYTPFQLDLTDKWKARQTNEIVVRVDNRFSPSSLPYERSFDWPNDGGIIRAVRLRVSPPNHLSRLHVTAQLSADFSKANIQVRARLSGKGEAK
ncbi:MAG TPA: hypothetical protein VNT26_06275, partial [Candidatus Sulfotelmatobacter sp.]|nr:hypothetical protein [Candidatus Sulfotelmatobacter sp.]